MIPFLFTNDIFHHEQYTVPSEKQRLFSKQRLVTSRWILVSVYIKQVIPNVFVHQSWNKKSSKRCYMLRARMLTNGFVYAILRQKATTLLWETLSTETTNRSPLYNTFKSVWINRFHLRPQKSEGDCDWNMGLSTTFSNWILDNSCIIALTPVFMLSSNIQLVRTWQTSKVVFKKAESFVSLDCVRKQHSNITYQHGQSCWRDESDGTTRKPQWTASVDSTIQRKTVGVSRTQIPWPISKWYMSQGPNELIWTRTRPSNLFEHHALGARQNQTLADSRTMITTTTSVCLEIELSMKENVRQCRVDNRTAPGWHQQLFVPPNVRNVHVRGMARTVMRSADDRMSKKSARKKG